MKKTSLNLIKLSRIITTIILLLFTLFSFSQKIPDYLKKEIVQIYIEGKEIEAKHENKLIQDFNKNFVLNELLIENTYQKNDFKIYKLSSLISHTSSHLVIFQEKKINVLNVNELNKSLYELLNILEKNESINKKKEITNIIKSFLKVKRDNYKMLNSLN